jgi:hypothetical protein
MSEVHWNRQWPAPKIGDVFVTSHAKGSTCYRAIIGVDEDENGWKALVVDEARNVVRITPGHLKFHSGVTRDAWRPMGTVWNETYQCWVPPGYEVVTTREFKHGVIQTVKNGDEKAAHPATEIIAAKALTPEPTTAITPTAIPSTPTTPSAAPKAPVPAAPSPRARTVA